jgi:hypothetical protein
MSIRQAVPFAMFSGQDLYRTFCGARVVIASAVYVLCE